MGDERRVYIEKMPEHILRAESLLQAFPDSKIIYLERHWLEVALSIENSFGSHAMNWYGYDSVKWTRALLPLALKQGLLRDTSNTPIISDTFTRGCIEWILCQKAFDTLHPRVMRVKYIDLLTGDKQFKTACSELEKYTGLAFQEADMSLIREPRNKLLYSQEQLTTALFNTNAGSVVMDDDKVLSKVSRLRDALSDEAIEYLVKFQQ